MIEKASQKKISQIMIALFQTLSFKLNLCMSYVANLADIFKMGVDDKSLH